MGVRTALLYSALFGIVVSLVLLLLTKGGLVELIEACGNEQASDARRRAARYRFAEQCTAGSSGSASKLWCPCVLVASHCLLGGNLKE